ncbi:hypothetical protein Sango_1524600 [Sesamum angolense]|uniref:Uncharacterized protein n=1 Tax=Sesamum angolense TaxID=2727404 RepID=A0AAE1WNW9_9LAMI|nr:hypothetical protein Sango_1524600 [Sesamum angolense]
MFKELEHVGGAVELHCIELLGEKAEELEENTMKMHLVRERRVSVGFLVPLMWYHATILYFGNYYRKDPRERAGLAASAITAMACSVVLILSGETKSVVEYSGFFLLLCPRQKKQRSILSYS